MPTNGSDLLLIERDGDAFKTTVYDVVAVRAMRPPWARKIASDWRTNTVSSAVCTAASLRAVPFSAVDNLDISAIEFYVQGSVTAGATMDIGIYDADPVTGMPTNLLWSNTYSLTSSGNKSVSISPSITNKTRVWVAHYISTGSTQFAVGAASGDAHRQLGLPVSTATNTSIISLIGNGVWNNEMPATFPFAADGTAVTTGGNIPQFNLVLDAP